MKKLVLSLLVAILAYSQTNSQLNLSSPTPPSVSNPSTSIVGGTTGTTSYYYWVIAKYPIGNAAPSNFAYIANAPNTLNGTNYIVVSWATVSGAIGYDIIRSTSSTLPTSGNIAVGINIVGNSVNDTGSALASYTVTTAQPANQIIYLDNQNCSVPSQKTTTNNSCTYNVKDYGVRGDGVTDDTVSLQKAITNSNYLFIPVGNYIISSALVINHNIVIQGSGGSGLNNGSSGGYNTFSPQSRIINTSLTNDILDIAPNSNWLAGVSISDVAFEGNMNVTGVTTGDGVVADGGNQAIRNLTLNRVLIFHAQGCGLRLANNTYMSSFNNLSAYRNHANGVCITDTTLGQPSQLNFYGLFDDLNTGQGFSITSSLAADINIYGGTIADSSLNGLYVASTSVNGRVISHGTHFENNTLSNVRLDGGIGHILDGILTIGDSASQYGIYINNPGSNFYQISATIRGLQSQTNVTNDILITSNTKTVIIDTGDTILTKYSISDSGSYTRYIGYPYNPMSVTTSSIGGSSLTTNTCTTLAVTMPNIIPPGLNSNMGVYINAQSNIGSNFAVSARVTSSTQVTVSVCNVSSVSATPTASVYNVKVWQ